MAWKYPSGSVKDKDPQLEVDTPVQPLNHGMYAPVQEQITNIRPQAQVSPVESLQGTNASQAAVPDSGTSSKRKGRGAMPKKPQGKGPTSTLKVAKEAKTPKEERYVYTVEQVPFQSHK